MKHLLQFGLISWAIFGAAIAVEVLLIVFLQKAIKQRFVLGFLSVAVVVGVTCAAAWIVGHLTP